MNKIVSLSIAGAICFGANVALSDVKIDGTTWRSLEKSDPSTLSTTLGDHVGKLVEVQFNFRGKDVRHIKPNWYEGSIWRPDATARKGFANVRVLVAKKDLSVFQSITTDSKSAALLTIYGRVERDADNDFFFVHLFGRKAAVDPAGNAILTW